MPEEEKLGTDNITLTYALNISLDGLRQAMRITDQLDSAIGPSSMENYKDKVNLEVSYGEYPPLANQDNSRGLGISVNIRAKKIGNLTDLVSGVAKNIVTCVTIKPMVTGSKHAKEKVDRYVVRKFPPNSS